MNNKNIRFLEDALLIDNKILAISDLHIGYEESIMGKSLFIRTQLKEMLEKLDRIFKLLNKEKIKVSEIIILGDLKHEFGTISDSEWRETIKLLDYLLQKTNNIKLIRGNHDTILGPIANKRGIEVLDYYKIRIKVNSEVKNVCFLHGDEVYGDCLESNILIMGHLHPAITLYDEYKNEKFKCFLKGNWKIGKKSKEVYVLPSFLPLIWGYDINELRGFSKKGKFSIVDEKSLKKFDVIVYNEKECKEYDFGKLKKLIEF